MKNFSNIFLNLQFHKKKFRLLIKKCLIYSRQKAYYKAKLNQSLKGVESLQVVHVETNEETDRRAPSSVYYSELYS